MKRGNTNICGPQGPGTSTCVRAHNRASATLLHTTEARSSTRTRVDPARPPPRGPRCPGSGSLRIEAHSQPAERRTSGCPSQSQVTGLELPLRTLTKSILQAGTQRPRQVGLESGSWGPPGGQSQQARAEGRELTRRATDPAGLVFGEDPGDLSPKASGLGLGPLCPPCPLVDMENVWRYYLWLSQLGGHAMASRRPRSGKRLPS